MRYTLNVLAPGHRNLAHRAGSSARHEARVAPRNRHRRRSQRRVCSTPHATDGIGSAPRAAPASAAAAARTADDASASATAAAFWGEARTYGV